jgi:AcrR family transcriptional regulator
VTSRGEATRARLLDAAEQLYGERGVEAVSLREIRLAAGQRNSSALQFHFGDRDGLLMALVDRHLPRIGRMHQHLYDAALADGRADDPRALVEVLVRPNADYVRRGPSERAWIRISAERSARPETAWADVIDHAPAAALEAGAALFERMVEVMPGRLAIERIRAVSQACLHLCADRARLEEWADHAGGPTPVDLDRWATNLVDMAAGAMLAPVTAGSIPGSDRHAG